MKDIAVVFMVSLVISLGTMLFYDSVVANSTEVKVIDLDYILSADEKLVKAGKMTPEEYKERAKLLRQLIRQEKGIVLNQYIKVNKELYPTVFGGTDITDDIIKAMKEHKE